MELWAAWLLVPPALVVVFVAATAMRELGRYLPIRKM
jgi:hypothetical protein